MRIFLYRESDLPDEVIPRGNNTPQIKPHKIAKANCKALLVVLCGVKYHGSDSITLKATKPKTKKKHAPAIMKRMKLAIPFNISLVFVYVVVFVI